MAGELPRPGVQVVQVFRTVTPTVITPTLVPCIVGVAKQIVEVFEQDDSGSNVLNGDALINLPGYFLATAAAGDPPLYTGLDGLQLVLSFNNAPNVTVLFSDPTSSGMSPATVVSQILSAFSTAGVTAGTAETVGDDQFQVRTVGTGDFQQVFVDATTSPSVLTAFGIGAGKLYRGVSVYQQYELPIPYASFPDPRGNLEELVIEADSIRAFLALGSGTDLREFSDSSAFLRNGTVNDAVVITGSADLGNLTLPADIQTLTFGIKVDGGATQTVTFTSGATTPALIASQINAQTTGLVATVQALTDFLVITSDAVGYDATLEIVAGGTALTPLGLTAGVYRGKNILVSDDGNGDNFSPLIKFDGEDFTASGTAAALVGSSVITSTFGNLDTLTLEISDGQLPQIITFDNPGNAAAVLTQINAIVGTAAGGRITATLNGSNNLVLTHARTGADSVIEIIGGTALTDLGLTAGTVGRGGPGKVLAGDELWIDGVLMGTVRTVAPGGVVDTLKIDSNLTISNDIGDSFYIIAKGLSSPPASDRPYPELVVSGAGTILLKSDVLRDTTGAALNSLNGRASVYVTYVAVRQDVSPAAENAGLLRFDSATQLESALAPINTQNPLALGLFFALINAPGVQVTGLGVDAVSADEPFGTPEAFARAAEFLEGFEVYALAPLTHNSSVGQIFSTHATFMSEPEQRGERVALFNSKRPTTKLDTLVASGAKGNSVGGGGTQFDTGVANLAALLLNAGVNPAGTITVDKGVYLDIASDSKRYSIQTVSGSIITIRTVFNAGENDDGYYATTDLNDSPLPSMLVNETFAVRIRGASLVTVDGTPDKQAMAETYQALSQSFANRRLWHTAPDTTAATIEGVEQLLEGFYMNAGIAGMIGQQPPQQSFTNFPMSGYTRVVGSSDFFSERQMNIMAAGGTYIMIQDAPGAPLISRMALTTDMTSIETRTDSITKVVDFSAKFLRRGLRNFIGRFNISQGFIDTLGNVVHGLLGFLVENSILIAGNLNNIIQDEDQPDTVLIDVTLDVPYPCNYIRLTLLI